MFHNHSSRVPSPSPRLGNTCALTALKFLMVTALLALSPCAPALAQGYPGGGGSHTHNWTPGPPIGASTLIVPSQYVRAGGILSVGGGSTVDQDTCTNPGCPLGGTGYDSLRITAWSDGGAGGQFGKLVGGVFQTCPANEVTHYRAPNTPTNGIRLTFTLDDVPDLADDPPVTTEVVKVTAWEYTITPCPGAWLPTVTPNPGGTLTPSTQTFTATLAPATDHRGVAMQDFISFSLGSSALRGYCCNAGNQTEPDLLFPDQGGFSITPDRSAADTTTPTLSATVTVACYDFGAYGTLNAYTTPLPSEPWLIGQVLAVRTNDKQKVGTGIPLDDNGNNIADGWAYDTYGGGDPNSDVDPTPLGLNPGDGYPLFDEYRGFMVQGAFERSRPDIKHVFVYNPGTFGMGNAGIWEFTFHLINGSEQLGKIVNYNGASSQNCIRIIEEPNNLHPDDDPVNPGILGYTQSIATPKLATQRIWIYLLPMNLNNADANRVIAHEVGHDVRCVHQSDYDPWWSNNPRVDSIMRQHYWVNGIPYPLAINGQDRSDRDLVDTTAR